ncbi:insulinase family protein [Candidatus Acetothermia bacterium]|jgi:zinc protease|nr:insulinase family protein [Candidatus Acetothermia bacterium]MCI2431885.1 insulinase family protein [Candidatus Acetothermia bacterium]MCI2437382.1 insulinase family protein [Candidatus Acetothermia bacterium]
METPQPKRSNRSVLWLAVPVVVLAVVAALALWQMGQTPALKVGSINKFTIDNGLTLLIYQDNTAPVVSVNLLYRVGSRDEPTGKRGMAHLMEHMMFKGSKNIKPEEHAKLIDQAGGRSNAFTSDDVTGYWAMLPQEKLELALRLEAERMENLIITQENLDAEREVVKEEWRVRLENQPVSKAFDKFRDIAFAGTPYAKGPEGYMEDLDSITVEDLQNFYKMYYAPNNGVLVVAGDVEANSVLALVQKYFGAIPKGATLPVVTITQPSQNEMREEFLQLAVQLPVIIGGYAVPGTGHPDQPALEVAGLILSGGQSARLYKSLVRDSQISVGAGGFPLVFKDLGTMLIYAFFTPDKDPAQVKEALLKEIERLANEPIDEKELQKAKNQLTARYIFGLDAISGVANKLAEAEVIQGDYREFERAKTRYDNITLADVQRVAQSYFKRENLTIVTLKPEGGAQ